MKAQQLADSPTKALEEIIEEVQQTANATQSEAWHLHEAGDGSVVEVRCAPEPAFRVDTGAQLPDIHEDNDGFLAERNGNLFKAVPRVVKTAETSNELLEELDAEEGRGLVRLSRPVKPLERGEDGQLIEADEGERGDEWAVVSFEWAEIDPRWKDGSVKKAADVRLTPRKSARIKDLEAVDPSLKAALRPDED